MASERYVAAGYLLVRPVPRPSRSSAELLPAQILSACTCLCPQFPGVHSIEWVRASEDERARDFEAVGLAPELRLEARHWATSEFERSLGWPGMFLRTEDALAARSRFFAPASAPVALGLALPEARLDAFLAEASPPPPAPGYAPQGESGFLTVARRREPLAAGHRPLGFELLELAAGQIGCSWLCNGLESHFASALGVRPGPNGLLSTLADAERCCASLDAGEVGAEPGPWLPWLLVEYPESP